MRRELKFFEMGLSLLRNVVHATALFELVNLIRATLLVISEQGIIILGYTR